MLGLTAAAVWGEPASLAGRADAPGGAAGRAAGGGDEKKPTAAVLRQ